jgi:hypothetical protein
MLHNLKRKQHDFCLGVFQFKPYKYEITDALIFDTMNKPSLVLSVKKIG